MMLTRFVSLCVLAVGCAPATPIHQTPIPPLAITTFDSAWALINATYFDSTFGGSNWNSVRAALRPEAASAATTEALRAVIRRMLDTLGESHARVLAREDVQPSTTDAALAEPGIDVRPTVQGMLITRVDSGSPADATIGLIQFDQWLFQVAAALDSAIYELRDARGLIIELRRNGGGLGSMVAGFSGYFVDTSTAVGIVRTNSPYCTSSRIRVWR